MKKLTIILFVAALYNIAAYAQSLPKPNTQWFEEARFGLFVHFGPYAVLGDGEWIMQTKPIKGHAYKRLQDLFNPQAFDAKEWVAIAKNAGMKYITFTSRHHDGFSNWDTKQSDWNIMNTPYGKDLIKQLAEECHKEGIKLVFYYSTIDWMRTDYQWETGRTGKDAGRTGSSNWDSYINFMKAQLTELLTNYGPIGGIWFDGHWDQTADDNRTDHSANVDWHYPELYALIRSLQPECLIANNHHLPPIEGEDYQIFERDVPGENASGYSGQEVSRLPLETCQTINGAWGFRITDDKFKSTKQLIHLLVRTAGVGANLLLNVGPMPNGKIQPECVERLANIGKWTKEYGQTIYKTEAGPVKPQTWGAITRKENIYYIHLLDPETTTLELELKGVKSVKWLNADMTDTKVTWKTNRKTGKTTFTFSGTMDDIDSILEVVVK
ncbi:alpha-L-fucosidase [Bacteroides sp. 214]|uniref:alpha-L-fucosidase n=1 Tax=Bacteroides sp. 214 TaxID=2302935 RepID=UPI0013D5DAEC|nr:alpha-L-fucosidase [Bacteroides sp. 214]